MSTAMENRVRLFRTSHEVRPLIEGRIQIPISQVSESSDLSNAYISGKIVSHSRLADEMASCQLTIQADSVLHFTVLVQGELAKHYPDASTSGILYVLGGTVEKAEPTDWSQACEFQLRADDSSDAQVILVHKTAKIKERGRPAVKHAEATIEVTPPAVLDGGERLLVLHTSRDEVEIGTLNESDQFNTFRNDQDTFRNDHETGTAVKDKLLGQNAALCAPNAGNGPGGASSSHCHPNGEVIGHPSSSHCHPNVEAVGHPSSSHCHPNVEVVGHPSSSHCHPNVEVVGYPINSGDCEGNNPRQSAQTKKAASPHRVAVGKRRAPTMPSSSDEEDTAITRHGKGKAAKPSGPTKKGEYCYTKLAQVKSGDDRVNVFGVVKFFKPPVQTRGTDFYSVVTIVDETKCEDGLKCVLFHRNRDRLPQFESIGDVICIHRLKIQLYNNELQGQGNSITSCICFDGDVSAQIVPRTGAHTYTLTDDDCARVKQLREWARHQPELNPRARARRLCEVKAGDYFDLACQVVTSSFFAASDYSVLLVWDGTRFPLEHKEYDYSFSETLSDVRLAAVAGDLAVPVVLYNNHSARARSIRPGQFVRLSNAHAAQFKGYSFVSKPRLYTELCLHRGTQYNTAVIVLPEGSDDVARLKEQLARVSSEGDRERAEEETTNASALHRWQQSPLPKSATLIPQSRVRFTPIHDILTHAQVPFKFHCRAKVQVVLPACVEEMAQLRCCRCARKTAMPRTSMADTEALVGTRCPACNNGDGGTGDSAIRHLIYVFKLLLEDESGYLDVYVAEDDAITFLPGLPPTNLYLDQDARSKLLDKLYFLTGGNNPFVEVPRGFKGQYPRPWMECCIKSYYHGRNNLPGENSSRPIRYRIFDTILNCLETENEESVTIEDR